MRQDGSPQASPSCRSYGDGFSLRGSSSPDAGDLKLGPDYRALAGSRQLGFSWVGFLSSPWPPCTGPERTAADPLAAQAQENKDGLIDALYIFGIEMPDAMSEFYFLVLW
jgi:hypothetical protein